MGFRGDWVQKIGRKNSILIGIILTLILLYTFIISLGRFNLIVGTRLQQDSFKVNENYYFGYEMHWDGPSNPIIEKFEMRRKDGTLYENNDKQVEISIFVDTSRYTGVLNEEMYNELVRLKKLDFKETMNFRVDGGFALVFKVKKTSDIYQDNISEVIVYYKLLGINRKQVFEFVGFTCE